MHFDYQEEQEMLRDFARGYLERVSPLSTCREGLDRAARRQNWKKDAVQSWTAILVSEECGGAGGNLVDAMVLAEELGRAAYGGAFSEGNIAAWLLDRCGSDESRQRFLPGIVEGSTIATWVPPSTNRKQPTQEIQGRSEGDHWTITGTARLVQDADIADLLLVPVRTEEGLVQLLIPTGSEGVAIRPARTIDISRSLCDINFTGEIPLTAIVAISADQTDATIDEALHIAATLVGADSVGAASRLLEMTVDYAKERTAFGKPIASFQAIKHRCADMLIQLEAARASVWYAAVAMRDRLADAHEGANIAKFFATEAASYIAGQALQLHGGIGFTWEHDLHVFLKRIKANEMRWGTNSWHRAQVAKELEL